MQTCFIWEGVASVAPFLVCCRKILHMRLKPMDNLAIPSPFTGIFAGTSDLATHRQRMS